MLPYEKIAKEIAELNSAFDKQLSDLKSEAMKIVSNCVHSWDETKYTPIYQEESEFNYNAGMFCEKFHIPAKTTPQWTRKCLKCGFEEKTTKTRSIAHPVFEK